MLRSLLIALTYFCLHTWLGLPQAKCQEELNMMNDAFDDQYLGCAKEMEKEALELLLVEKQKSQEFRLVWEKAEVKWKEVKMSSPLKQDEYGIALVAYTDQRRIFSNEAFPTVFKEAVKVAGTSRAHYMDHFRFKAFHYYLTRALQLLRERCDGMYNMPKFRGDPKTFNYKGGNIRFGHFSSSSTKKEVAEGFAIKKIFFIKMPGTLFTIRTCFGVEIQGLSHQPEQEEVLIPVHEIFSVTETGSNRFELRSTNRTCSHFNCAYLGGEKNQTCVDNSATRRGLAFPSELSPSLFGGSIILVHVAALKLFASF